MYVQSVHLLFLTIGKSSANCVFIYSLQYNQLGSFTGNWNYLLDLQTDCQHIILSSKYLDIYSCYTSYLTFTQYLSLLNSSMRFYIVCLIRPHLTFSAKCFLLYSQAFLSLVCSAQRQIVRKTNILKINKQHTTGETSARYKERGD